MSARIYRPARTRCIGPGQDKGVGVRAGRRATFEPRRLDGARRTETQIKLRFDSKEDAAASAQRKWHRLSGGGDQGGRAHVVSSPII